MVCACIPAGLVVFRGRTFYFDAHMFCVDCADDDVP